MNSFVYNIPTKVYFGVNQLHNLGAEISVYGKRVLMTYGGGSIKRTGLYDRVMTELKNSGAEVYELGGIAPNPRVSSVREGARICKEHNIDVLLAVGGGSTIDCTKWIAASACVDHDAWDFFNEKKAPVNKALPIITILTLAATGSEMDSGGVISNPETNDKIGRLSPLLFPKVSFLDPTVTYTVNRYQTACGTADIFSHICEQYFNLNEDLEMLDQIMEALMRTLIQFAPVALKKPEDYEARANLMWASSWAINGFISGGRTKAWSCHPMEHELSAFYDITHGHGLAILTPRWLRYCISKNDDVVPRIARFATNVFGVVKRTNNLDVAKEGIALLEKFMYRNLGLKSSLSNLGIDSSNFAVMAEKACGGDCIHGFVDLRKEDIEKIYRNCL